MTTHTRPGWLGRLVATARHSPWLIVLVVVAFVAAAVLVWVSVLDRQDAVDERADREQTQVALDQTAAQARSLAEQIRDECAAGQLPRRLCEDAAEVAATPVPVPVPLPDPPQDGTDGVTPACMNTPAQCQGPRGDPGTNGQTPACMNTPEQCQGPRGDPGTDGVTPACMNTPAQCQGPRGDPGTDGQTPACMNTPEQCQGPPPAGLTIVEQDGTTKTCSRDPNSPNDAATYTCTANGPPPPSGGTGDVEPNTAPAGGIRLLAVR